VKVVILPQAAAELKDAVEYYEAEQSGLGERLWVEFDQHLGWIAGNATLPRLRSGAYRRVNFKIFPYYVAYALREDHIVVLAVSHAARAPEHWIKRG